MAVQLILYLPVIHAGYEQLLGRHEQDATVFVLGRSFAEVYPVLKKEIRALDPHRAAAYLRCLDAQRTVEVVEEPDLPGVLTDAPIVLPDEDIMRDLAERYRLAERGEVRFEPTFLRWDRGWSQPGRPADFDGRIATDELAVAFGRAALAERARSSDWWRQVGAVAVRDGVVVGSAHNRHHPSEYSPYIDGDPRNSYSRGVRADLSTALHAEAAIVATAARDGLSLRGAEIFVSTFPCPTCARLIAEAGFAKCYFMGPYSVLNGDHVLRSAGVELIFVEVPGDH